MPDELVLFWLIIGFSFLVIAGRWLGTDQRGIYGGLFARQGARDWPTGVQEPDAPRFALDHLDALRPQRTATSGHLPLDAEDAAAFEFVELGGARSDRGG